MSWKWLKFGILNTGSTAGENEIPKQRLFFDLCYFQKMSKKPSRKWIRDQAFGM